MSDNMGNCKRYLKALATLAVIAPSSAYTPDARWGQAATIIGNTLYVQGGKVDPSNMYSYSAAPNTDDLLSLDLSAPFALTDAPWAYVTGSSAASTSQGPSVAFHSLTAFNEATMLAFGGDGGSSMVSPSGSNSAWLLDVTSPSTPRWLEQPDGWVNEPVRPIRHAAASAFGRVWIIGGERADGSNLAVTGHYVFQPSVPSFDLLPTDSAPPVLYGHASIRLGSNILLVFGGYDASSNALVDMSSLWLVDTSLATPVWSTTSAAGDVPAPRRDFAYTLLGDGRVFVHGGTDATMQTVYSDAAILDVTRMPMQWSSLGELDQVGARRNHMAVGIGAQVLINFGFGVNGPAPASLILFETGDNSWGTTFTPVPTPTALPNSVSNPSATSTNISSQGTQPPAQSTAPSSQSASQPVGTQTAAPGTSHVSNPGPVPTKSQSHTNRPSHTSSTAIPSPTSSLPPGSEDGAASNLKKIAIGAVVAVVVLVGLVLCGAYFALRRRRPIWRRGDGSARLIAGEFSADEGYGSGAAEPKGIPLAGSSWQALPSPRRQWTLLGLGTRQGYGRERFDILHDEDIREFGDFSASRTSVRREASQGSGRSGWGGVVNASTASLRSFGAVLGLGRGVRQSSYGSVPTPTPEAREKEASDPFLDTSHVLYSMPGSSITRPRAVRQESSSSLRAVTYTNPFDDSAHDPLVSRTQTNLDEVQSFDEREGLVGAFRQQDLEDHGHYDRSEIPASLETYGLAALGRPRSHSDLAHSGGSVSSWNAPAFGSGSATAAGSASSHDNYAVSLLSSAPSAPIRRSDSWWSRFSRGTLRGDRATHDGFSVARKLSRNSDRQPKSDAFIDFRDPNPPPTLRTMAPIRESGVTPDVSPQNPTSGVHVGSVGAHRRSASSLVTVRTADSAALERIGQLDIVQRVRTASYHAHSQSLSLETSPESVEEPDTATKQIMRRPRLSIVPGSPSKTITESGHSRASTPSLSEDHGTVVASPTELASSVGHASSPTKATTPVQVRARRPTGEVAKRIADYERRMTETNAAPSSPRKSPVSGEDRPRSRMRVEYGLVPRPELFIANPDGRGSPST